MSKNKTKFKYIGIKITDKRIKEDLHFTLEFFSKEKTTEEVINIINNIPLGQDVGVKITQIGFYNNTNIAYKIDLSQSPIKKYFKGKIPHITIKVMNNGKAVDSWKCFTDEGIAIDLIKSEWLCGVYGYFDYNNNFYTEPIK